jgi:hypothetical protein
VLIPAGGTSRNDGVAQSRGRFAPWDAPEGPGSSGVGAASLKTGTGPGDAPSCAVAVVTYVKPVQP